MRAFQYAGKQSQSFLFYTFLGAWTLINLLNAAFTGLAHDEAYYWVYAQNLDWGYYDHPPGVAGFIKAGYALFSNVLGVRLVNVLGSSVALLILWRLCARRYGEDVLLFIFLATGLVVFHVYGFVIVPDSPLLFAIALYFWALEKYLREEGVRNILLVSLCVVLMLYSKYHGLLVLFFTLVAIPGLLRKRSFWIIFFLSLLLFFPHIWWQVENNFITLRFHLFERSSPDYRLSFTTDYLLGVLLITGPLLGLILWFVVLKVKTASKWERALRYNIIGFVLFFLLSSFNQKIEANWVSPVAIPLLIISYKYLIDKRGLRKWTLMIGGVSLMAALLFRIHTLTGSSRYDHPGEARLKKEFYNWDEWARQIAARSGEEAVVFLNSYQHTSKFMFYTGSPAHSYNTVGRRRNQFDLMDTETYLQGKDITVISRDPHPQMSVFETVHGNFYSGEIANFRSYNKVKISVDEDELVFRPATKNRLRLVMENNFPFSVDFTENPDYPVEILVSFFSDGQPVREQSFPVELEGELAPGESFVQIVELETPRTKGNYHIFISFKSNWLDPGLNYSNKNLRIQ